MGVPLAITADNARSVRSVVVLRPNYRLGNTLLLLPLMQELEGRFPEARITLVTGLGATSALYRSYERVSGEHFFPPYRPRQSARFIRTLWALRRSSFDLAIDPVIRSRSGRTLLSFVRARAVVGFRWGDRHDRMLTHAADPRAAPEHFTQGPIWLLRSAYLGLNSQQVVDAAPPPMDLRLTPEERRQGQVRLAATLSAAGSAESPEWQARPRVAIFANATGAKLYPPDWWRQLIGSLRGSHAQFVEIIPADGRPRLPEIPGVFTPELRMLAATLAATSLVVVADGGVMHLAEAAGAPVLGLFRTTEPGKYAPLRPGSEALWAQDLGVEGVAARMRDLLFRSEGRAAG